MSQDNLSEYAKRLITIGNLSEPAIRQAISQLTPAPGMDCLDAGCGIGKHTLWLAESVQPGGRVTGMDISQEFLGYAEQQAGKLPYADKIDFKKGDLFNLPFEEYSYDLAWSCDCLYPVYGGKHPVDALRELARVVKPGGKVAAAFWANQCLLPGYPVLEAKLNKLYAEHSPYLCAISPDQHYLRALRWLKSAGLVNTTAHCFTSYFSAPLDDITRKALEYTYDMFWGNLKEYAEKETWSDFESLCTPGSDRFILDTDDYFGFLNYSLFIGEVVS